MEDLEAIYVYMNECGFSAEMRYDRYRRGEICPYVNHGDSSHPNDRVQFWMEKNGYSNVCRNQYGKMVH